MAFFEPEFSKSQVNLAGGILIDPDSTTNDWLWALDVLTNWRACHGYPINTFQATLRLKIKSIDDKALVAQRLKRASSITAKLRRYSGMQLSRMQDIGGLRAIVKNISSARKLEQAYRKARFKHELISSKDYIATPKVDGYRGIHLIYRYHNDLAPAYDGLSLELQIRTKRQHAWATAVETMGTFLNQALKSGQGESRWRDFFVTASAALTISEKMPAVPGYEGLTAGDVYAELAAKERQLHVLDQLRTFAVATDHISSSPGSGAYHLIVLDWGNKTVHITPYSKERLEVANVEYSKVEKRINDGEPVEAVLVSAGPISTLKKAYPNYFLDTQGFITEVEKLIRQAS